METRPLPFQKIILVCTNSREPGERVCCAGRDSVALHADLKEWVAQQGLKRYVRVCKSGCMDRCEDGPNALIMPDNIWVCGLDRDGLDALKTRILKDCKEGPAAPDREGA
jgi:(2Fe-2S) ferredoxin